MIEGERILKVNIEEEMKTAYIDYSMSVIVSRALPDVRDGLKPVHRRVLFGMSELGVMSNKPYKKSARIVGEVLGKFHPHGDSSVYEAMVRMAQPWSLRYPLVDGQGNFGSVDGDSPAAMRYTEARMQKITEETLRDIEKNTVDFQLNFDDTIEEPTVLPTRIPTLLVNGTSGIAVGMATNMAPHNLTDTINAIVAYIDDNNIDIQNLIDIIKAPDFPTGGIIYGLQGFKDAYETGRGRILIRSKVEIETEANGRERIIVTEIPYMVNKAELIKKTAELVNEKKIDGITNINDESDRTGMRIVYDIRRDTMANVVLNKLFKYTQLQTSFNVNSIALVKGRPKVLNLKQLIEYFVAHRHEVVIRRTHYELEQAEKKAHILEGLLIALDHLDEVISLIRASKTPEEAKDGLMMKFELSEIQAKAILDMRLQKLTGLEREKIKEEYAELQKLIAYLKTILEDIVLRMKIIKDELLEIKDHFGDDRRTEIVPDEGEFNPEDFYVDEDMVVTISHLGYIKRTPVTEFRTQNRGGVGAKGSTTRDEDFLEHMFIASMHNTMLFFTEKGRCFWLKVYEIPEGAKNSKGRAIQNIIHIEPDDKVKAYINVKNLTDKEYLENNFIVMCTKKGIIKKTSLKEYSRPRQNGVNAITIKEDDHLLQAKLTNGKSDIILATREGKAVRFNESKVRSIGRTGAGVRGITLSKPDDEVVGMVYVEAIDNEILVVSENGYGKRSNIEDYRITNRGGKGVKTINITEKTGKLITIKGVDDTVDLMIINRSGLTLRIAVSNLRVSGRATQGVRLINLKNNDSIAAVAQIEKTDDDIEITETDIEPSEE
ncbi:MAG: DNA gyrase subunit A [Bacteroidetes bacterium GWC2_33_15]|nr:MAG: DNA gyrase subunit A [Bacteroidetes bacterium GWA2_33_15]OFX50655.1 MAG: DNA gyrase subunit A [Bacteroidetes bacterium GWC2_33_15]OFX63249.1 MAG: DNA gyrase subunit A [Bacteroidetes bacterium GWB2_32_14]OFX69804.1 MAG: DNA gyrase subunit A [Bacteroidetes bacterium GWD2_33_33]HAN19847.1 DNA gyrase subunit A [Bacteroidales bacterium]